MVRIHSGSPLFNMEDIHQQIHEEFINSEEYDKYLYDIYNYEKKSKFDGFLTSSIQTFAQKKIKHNYSLQKKVISTVSHRR